MDFTMKQVYPGYQSQIDMSQEVAVDTPAQQILAEPGGGIGILANKGKTYNITSALIALILLIVIFQIVK